jgi:hypothetical protein
LQGETSDGIFCVFHLISSASSDAYITAALSDRLRDFCGPLSKYNEFIGKKSGRNQYGGT